MTELALSDEILMAVDKPSRYIGNEINMVVKDPASVEIRFAMCFPDVYEIGMSYLGIQILYDMFNRREDTWCERVYSPWPDLDRVMREQNIPLFALESQSPVRDFDFLGITIQYEMCYTNILQVLDLAGIPLKSEDRKKGDLFVIGGGPCTYNPEPIADFFDIFYIGEGEEKYAELLELYKQYKHSDMTRREFLIRASGIDGMYVPSLYEVTYREDGVIASVTTVDPRVPERVKKVVVTDFDQVSYPMAPVVPYLRATQDRVVLEVMRGCIRGCRFCQAGMIYRPTRQKPVELVTGYVGTMLKNTGYDEISISSLSTSDYEGLPQLMDFLVDRIEKDHIQVSLPTLRLDAFSLDVMKKVQDIHKVSLTFAPEAGSQRLRDVINKGLSEEVILDGVTQAFSGGWNKVKLYFMLGHPTETYEDIEGIAILSDKIAREYYTIPKEERHGKVEITSSTSFFVPKPFTPFQWMAMNTAQEFLDKAKFLSGKMKEQLNARSIKYNWHDADTTMIEGLLARGDRKLSKVIYEVYKGGNIYDAWTEYFNYQRWLDVLSDNGLSLEFYACRERTKEEILPWDFIDVGVTRAFLYREYEKSKRAEITPNCKMQCSGCGAASFGGGICNEHKNAVL